MGACISSGLMSSLPRQQRGNSRTNTVLNSMGESAEANPQSLRPGVVATERRFASRWWTPFKYDRSPLLQSCKRLSKRRALDVMVCGARDLETRLCLRIRLWSYRLLSRILTVALVTRKISERCRCISSQENRRHIFCVRSSGLPRLSLVALKNAGSGKKPGCNVVSLFFRLLRATGQR